ncbi:MAG: histidine kinase [Desulfovibrionaceae bacterium]|nr:histidine kinase [Desulfovibrionaceae bacterium]
MTENKPTKRSSLRAKILLPLLGLALIAILGAAATLWTAHGARGLLSGLEDRHLALVLAAQAMQSELLLQKDALADYLVSGRQEALDRLNEHREAFENRLARALKLDAGVQDRYILRSIQAGYPQISQGMDQAADLGRRGLAAQAEEALERAAAAGSDIRAKCRELRIAHEGMIASARQALERRTWLLSVACAASFPATAALALWLWYILIMRVLEPIRRLALGRESDGQGRELSGEVGALSERMLNLLEDVDQAHIKLEQSRRHLEQAEKLALVGKLAASAAHSIRNPLTSVKMRLFSLERGLRLDPLHKEDFEVISEEIRHLDTIIKNFLEFSRPPKLNFQRMHISEVVDNTLRLLRHRLESCAVEVRLKRDKSLPRTDLDPEQLKEALVNLILNACEAMPGGGVIEITEETGLIGPTGRVVVVRVSDTGPGIPASIQDDIFQPFFSTKEEGTGLGLAIVKRIVEEHGGWVNLRSGKGRGASFVLAIPCKEKSTWLRSLS